MGRSVVVSLAALRRAWDDRSLTVPEVAARFAIAPRTVQKLARANGWPPRSSRKRSARLTPGLVRPLWDAGLRCADIAVLLGAGEDAVQAVAWRAGWRRGRGWIARVTLADWAAARLRERAAPARTAARLRDGPARWAA